MAFLNSLQALARNAGIEKPVFDPLHGFGGKSIKIPGYAGVFGNLTDSESVRILIQESESSILDIDAKIAHLSSQIRDLVCLRQLEREKITTLCAVAASIRRLPTELLTDIFLLFVEDYADYRRPVLRLSQVSSYWRQVAHSTPRLWTFLYLRPKTKPTEDYMSSTKAWMERSSPLPVSVHVDTTLPAMDLAGLMNVLLSVANRWTALNTTFKTLRSFPQLPSDGFPTLETISLNGEDGHMYDLNVQAFTTAPRLHNVRLTPQIGSVLMPWAQLTELDIADHSLTRCLDTLGLCQNLVSARISISARETLPSSPTKRTLPFLTRLDISCGRNSHVSPLFDSLYLPKLESLQLFMVSVISWPGDSVSQFLKQSPLVHDIALTAGLDGVELVQFLRHASSVTKLDLSCRSATTEHFFEALQYRDSDIQPLVPRLNSLNISVHDVQFSLATMEKIIRSRWWSDAQLRALAVPPRVARLGHVYMIFDDTAFGRQLRERLRDCVKEGLRFNHS
ncbi:hypothetical protein C8J57DRAFT_661697 [Mycena rebaudengoi]|nr:hypothetical protein C8J57DRAFT_661697 [Mycena rebaudengoi]